MAPTSVPVDEGVDYYEFLSIEAIATDAEIQRAYRRTNLKYHPDKFKPTPELSLEQAASKLDLLQKILIVLKDPAKRAEYDRKREIKRRDEATRKQMASERKILATNLVEREKEAIAKTNGVKRKYGEHDRMVQDVQATNKALGEALTKQRQEERVRLHEAAEAQRRKDTSSDSEEKIRLVKIVWIREGDGLDIDEAAVKEMSEVFGPVEHVRVMKDKKRRIDGRKEKTVFGNAVVLFETPSAAQYAVSKGPWEGVESVERAFKDTDPL